MKKVEYYCDHCGRQVDSRTGYTELDVGIEPTTLADLCCECVDELDKLIITFCNFKRKDGADNDR